MSTSRPLRHEKLPIVDTTVRKGEQFATADFTSSDREYIAKILDRLGVEFIETANTAVSTTGVAELANVSNLKLKSKVLCHNRCGLYDQNLAVSSWCTGFNISMATSPILAAHSDGKAISENSRIVEEAKTYVKKAGLETRFSCKDTFLSETSDLVRISKAAGTLGVDRVGIADTVYTPAVRQMYNFAGRSRSTVIPFNSARLSSLDSEGIKKEYDLKVIPHLERFVTPISDVPFNNCVIGRCGFTHKARVHTKPLLWNNQDSVATLLSFCVKTPSAVVRKTWQPLLQWIRAQIGSTSLWCKSFVTMLQCALHQCGVTAAARVRSFLQSIGNRMTRLGWRLLLGALTLPPNNDDDEEEYVTIQLGSRAFLNMLHLPLVEVADHDDEEYITVQLSPSWNQASNSGLGPLAIGTYFNDEFGFGFTDSPWLPLPTQSQFPDTEPSQDIVDEGQETTSTALSALEGSISFEPSTLQQQQQQQPTEPISCNQPN